MNRTFRRIFQENFGLKVLATFIAVIVFVVAAFTTIAVVHESSGAKDNLRAQGELLAGLLARSSVVGVFAENGKLLADSAEGIMAMKDVVAVSIYTTGFKVLYAGNKTASGRDQPALHRSGGGDRDQVGSVHVIETDEAFDFMRPVMISAAVKADESLYFGGGNRSAREKVIGYVRIELSKDSYHREMLAIVERNAAIMLFFTLSGIAIVYLALKRFIRPLEKLTEGVKALGKGARVERVPVESADELGRLASAFNEMVLAREKAQESLRLYHEQLVVLSSELLTVEEKERRRIAVDLHDSVGQLLAASKIKLGSLRKALPPGSSTNDLDDIRAFIDQSIQFTRSLTHELSPPALHELGLEAAVEGLASQLRQQHGIAVTVDTCGMAAEALSEEVKILLFKTIRELLMNVVKHAEARTAGVSIEMDDSLIRIEVRDDGKGFDAGHRVVRNGKLGGFGLFSIRERLKYLGGRLEVCPARDGGACVVVTAPRRGPGINIGG